MAIKQDFFGQNVADQLANTNKILATIARNNLDYDNLLFRDIDAIANKGTIGDLFSVGDQFIDPWKDGETEYQVPWQINAIRDVELEDGEILKNRPFIQWHYCSPFGIPFSKRAFLRCPDGLAAGTYYFTIESKWGSNVLAGDIVCFTTTQAVPAGGRVAGLYSAPDTAKSNWRVYTYAANGIDLIETITPTFTASGKDLGIMKYATRNGDLNSIQEAAYAWNRWSTSALRQYLNSTATKGNWWVAQDEWDIAPSELSSHDGFLCGCSEDLLNSLKKVKVVTYTNTVNDGGEADITYDRIFIPSLEEMYCQPQISGEGAYHEYWKRKSERTSPCQQYQTYPQMRTYAINAKTSPQTVRLRSAYRGTALNTWYVSSSGNVNGTNASSAYRFSPLGII